MFCLARFAPMTMYRRAADNFQILFLTLSPVAGRLSEGDATRRRHVDLAALVYVCLLE